MYWFFFWLAYYKSRTQLEEQGAIIYYWIKKVGMGGAKGGTWDGKTDTFYIKRFGQFYFKNGEFKNFEKYIDTHTNVWYKWFASLSRYK